MNDAGVVVITAFISPFIEDRLAARETIGGDRFSEVYVSTPLEVCEKRDPKGLYQKARSGEIKGFTGLDAPYEPPEKPDFTLDTSSASLDECTEKLLKWLKPLIIS